MANAPDGSSDALSSGALDALDGAAVADAVPTPDASTEAESPSEGGVDDAPAQPAEGGAIDAPPATDPISVSQTSLLFNGECGESVFTPEPQSFAITNLASTATTWFATVARSNVKLDTTGSTLSPGASITVTVTPVPVPQYPTSLLIDSGQISIRSAAAGGAEFTDAVTIQEFAVGCLITTPASVDFGNVPLGSTGEVDLPPSSSSCYAFLDTEIRTGGVEILPTPANPFGSIREFDAIRGGSFLGGWALLFNPVDPVSGLGKLGLHTGSYTVLPRAANGALAICQPGGGVIVARGTGVP
jgi:hypothetical protein